MRFVNKKLKPFNTQENYREFKNDAELTAFIDKNKIYDRQEFWFSVDGSNCLFSCVFEYFYEG